MVRLLSVGFLLERPYTERCRRISEITVFRRRATVWRRPRMGRRGPLGPRERGLRPPTALHCIASACVRTPLYGKHVELGAKLVDFAGWEMPVTYEGVREEHSAVRTHAGMFDVSHMGEVEVEGPGALGFLQRVLSNDVAAIGLGGAQYSCLCNEEGGVLDDLFAYRLGGDRFLLVTNSANHAADLAWLGRWSRDLTSRCATSPIATRCSLFRVRTHGRSWPHARRSSCRCGCASRRRASAIARRLPVAPATPVRTGSSC